MISDEEILKLTKYAVSKYSCGIEIYGSYEDMLQEMLLYVYKKIPQYSPEISKISTFIIMVVKMKFLHDLRRAKSDPHKVNYGSNCRSLQEVIINSDNTPILLQDTIESTDNSFEDLENKLLIEYIMPYVKTETKLYYLEGMSQEDIAQRLNISQAYVSRKIRKNLRELRNILDGNIPQKKSKEEVLEYSEKNKCSLRTAYRRMHFDKKDPLNKKEKII